MPLQATRSQPAKVREVKAAGFICPDNLVICSFGYSMRSMCRRILTWALAVLVGLPSLGLGSIWAKTKTSDKRIVRWTEGAPGSTLNPTEDGKYLYTLIDADFRITIGVDSQELQKIRHRPLPVLFLRIDALYSGTAPLDLGTERMSLEFVRHYQVVTSALDPDGLGGRIQTDMENLTDEVEHAVRRHPEKKQEEEKTLQAHLKDMTDLLGFISAHGLRDVALDPGNPEVSGWVFFSAKSKWIGAWKPPEDFILRIPFKDRVFEIPFSLPPHKGALLMRRRDE